MESEEKMSTATETTLRQLLEKGISVAREEAQKEVVDLLPMHQYLGLEAFGQRGKELSFDEIMSFLYRDGTFPRVVNICIRGIRDERTFVWIRPSGHTYVSDFSQTLNQPTGMGPFSSGGLMLPGAMWEHPRPFSLQDLKEAGEKW
jgi:hypothetical protein